MVKDFKSKEELLNWVRSILEDRFSPYELFYIAWEALSVSYFTIN